MASREDVGPTRFRPKAGHIQVNQLDQREVNFFRVHLHASDLKSPTQQARSLSYSSRFCIWENEHFLVGWSWKDEHFMAVYRGETDWRIREEREQLVVSEMMDDGG